MKVKCIKKPHNGYIERNVTVGEVYDVVLSCNFDYKLINNLGEHYYYPKDCFEEVIDISSKEIDIEGMFEFILKSSISLMSIKSFLTYDDILVSLPFYVKETIKYNHRSLGLEFEVYFQTEPVPDLIFNHEIQSNHENKITVFCKHLNMNLPKYEMEL